MTYGQAGAVCPQGGSAAAVHSVEELAAMARGQLGQFGPGYQTPGYQAPPASSSPGSPPPASGFPSAPLSPEFPSSPLPPPPPPDYSGAPPRGYTGQARPGRGRSSRSWEGSDGDPSGSDSLEAAAAGTALECYPEVICSRVTGPRPHPETLARA